MGFATCVNRFCRRMPCVLHYFALLLPLAMSMVSVVNSGGRTLPPVFWNASNSMFLMSNNDHIIDINIGDRLDIICPLYSSSSNSKLWEYYIIYKVKKEDYDSCILRNMSEVSLLLKCGNPTRFNSYTMYIRRFQSIPGNPDFNPGETYYYITTSRGGQKEMDNQVFGSCLTKHMKMMLKIHNGTTPTRTKAPTSRVTATPAPTVKQKTTTIKTTSTTRAPTTTPTTVTTTYKMTKTEKPTNTDSNKPVPGTNDLPDENVINANGNGPKNVGFISDSGSQHQSVISFSLLLLTLTVAMFCR